MGAWCCIVREGVVLLLVLVVRLGLLVVFAAAAPVVA
jgi:hypothetical protein